MHTGMGKNMIALLPSAAGDKHIHYLKKYIEIRAGFIFFLQTQQQRLVSSTNQSLTCPPPPNMSLTSTPKLFWLITLNVILIKNGGVKGFSLPEKRVQIAAQWHSPSLASQKMHPDITRVVPTRREPEESKTNK